MWEKLYKIKLCIIRNTLNDIVRAAYWKPEHIDNEEGGIESSSFLEKVR